MTTNKTRSKRIASILLVGIIIVYAMLPLAVEAQSAPTGSYQRTCRDIKMQGSTLGATCQTISGEWKQTSIDTASCASEISNENGTLSCRHAPQGPQYVCISIESLRSLHHFDGNSEGDFYALVQLGDQSVRTNQTSNSTYIGDWTACGYLSTGQTITVSILDSDGSSSGDDLADLSSSNNKALLLTLEFFGNSCRVWYPTTGGANGLGSLQDRCDISWSDAGTERPAAAVSWHIWTE